MSQLAFDLEQDILRCWNVTTDLGEILDDVEEGRMQIDEAVRALRTYQRVYELRFDRCFRKFEEFNREAWTARKRAQELEKDLGEPKKPAASMAKKGKSKKQKEVDQ